MKEQFLNWKIFLRKLFSTQIREAEIKNMKKRNRLKRSNTLLIWIQEGAKKERSITQRDIGLNFPEKVDWLDLPKKKKAAILRTMWYTVNQERNQ